MYNVETCSSSNLLFTDCTVAFLKTMNNKQELKSKNIGDWHKTVY